MLVANRGNEVLM